jgi:hypothetical protein
MKKCTSAVLWGCHSPSAIAAISSAVEDGRLRIGAWFGNASECTHKLDPFIHQFQLDHHQKSSHPLVDRLEPDELITFCDMYSRVSRSRGLSIQELSHTAHIYFNYFAHLLVEKETELAIFSSPPHFGVDYLLYLAAQKMGLETLFCYQTLFPNRFFVTRRIEDFGIFEDAISQTDIAPISVKQTYEKNLFYMQSVRTKPERALLSLINDIRRNFLRSSSKPMSLSGIIEKYRETRDWNHNNPRLSTRKISLDTPYVYFPLQLQPEMTTSALGSRYSDQITALEVLNKLIPEDWLIYVKENPKQTHRQRGDTFMRRLTSIPKVRYVDKGINTYELLRHSRFASTITGTVGWEAISGGKQALVFGNPWYKQLEGVVQYKTSTTLDDIINLKFEHEALEASLNNLMSKSVEGVIDPEYRGIVKDYNEPRNTKLITNFLNKALEGSLFTSKRPQHEA